MKAIQLFILLCCAAPGIKAQWTTTPSPLSTYRHDDVYFLNPDTGWAVNYSLGNNGYVIKTVNGGASWQKQVDSSGAKFRDIGFIDSLNGFIGTLETGYDPGDTVIMYKTTDGGTTWSNVANLPGPRPGGICGMFVVNDSTLYACGRYYGPAGFYKTTDKGISWSYTSMTGLAGGIVDIHFFDKDTGIAVGGTIPNYLNAQGRILKTVDGGNTWTIAHTSAHPQEIGWKISFPSRNTGYVSLESFRASGPQYFLKTTDGGNTWQDMQFLASGTFSAQGIGFLNDTIGWIGGSSFNYKTTNGGLTWSSDNFGTPVNRFRFFGDTLGYAAGRYIYKYNGGPIGIGSWELPAEKPLLVYPNPFSESVTISKTWDLKLNAMLVLYDCFGRKVYAQKLNQEQTEIIEPRLEQGIYFYQVTVSDGKSRTGKLVCK
ncbi:MAG: Uncharacterized protein FD123_2100 [Bacteroidetes bacterium]|nr:MAG: Uncharacterized protein FD123_2100 [Bacteroidota bacterium]